MNIELNYMQEDGSYMILYPQTLGSLVSGAVAQATNATSANSATSASKLSTARSIQTDLSSTKSVNFDGQNNINPGVKGVLGVANGGTGQTTISDFVTSIADYTSHIYKTAYTGTGSSATVTLPASFDGIMSWMFIVGEGTGNYSYVFATLPSGSKLKGFTVSTSNAINTFSSTYSNNNGSVKITTSQLVVNSMYYNVLAFIKG